MDAYVTVIQGSSGDIKNQGVLMRMFNLKSILKKCFFVFTILGIGLLLIQQSYAEETKIIPINDEIAFERTTLEMNIPKEGNLPWGIVEGKIENPAKDYPVVIQFYKNGELVHIAQVNVDDEDSYEYKFRVRTVDQGKTIYIFEGDYTVKIFKVINLTEESA